MRSFWAQCRVLAAVRVETKKGSWDFSRNQSVTVTFTYGRPENGYTLHISTADKDAKRSVQLQITQVRGKRSYRNPVGGAAVLSYMITNDALTVGGEGHGLSHLANFLQQDEEEQQQTLVSAAAAAEDREETKQLQLLLESINTTLFVHQLPSQGLSFQLWPAASTLVSLIDRNKNSSNPILSFLSPPVSQPNSKPIRILELGSGTGLVGIAAASLLHAHVTLTDLPHVLPNLQFNSDANAAATATNGGTVEVRCLRWGEPEDMASLGHQFDLILASDVVYHDHLFDPLLHTLSFFLQGQVTFVMAHLRRWKKDGVFFKRARKLFEVRMIHTDEPLPGSRTGVAVYHFTGKHQNNSKKTLVSVP